MNTIENTIALVVLLDPGDDRAKSWARLLTGVFSDVYVVHGVNSWGKLDVVEDKIKTLLNSERPSPLQVSAVFTHRNDDKKDVARILDTIEGHYHRFVFSGPGVPEGDSTVIPIVRNTVPWCLSEQDAQELRDFVVGIRKDLPSCCRRDSFRFLVALAILCQGYLAARGRADLLNIEPRVLEQCSQSKTAAASVLDKSWWLAPFGGDVESLRTAIRRECSTQDTPTEVESLLATLGDNDDHKVASALKSILDILNS